MAIMKLSQEEVERLDIAREPMILNSFAEEIKWFADNQLKLLGVLLHDKIDDDYAYVILTKYDNETEYRAYSTKVSIEKIHTAERELINEMNKILREGIDI